MGDRKIHESLEKKNLFLVIDLKCGSQL